MVILMSKLNPFNKLFYAIFSLLFIVVFDNPIMILIYSLISIIYLLKILKTNYLKYMRTFFLISFVFSLAYILNNHFGITPLVLSPFGNYITLEALVYGISLGFRLFNFLNCLLIIKRTIFIDDISYIFGSISPKSALFLSVFHRLGEEYIERLKKSNRQSKAIGKERKKIFFRNFSISITWIYEKTVEKFRKMRMKGFSLMNRTYYKRNKFSDLDRGYLIINVIFIITIILGKYKGILYFSYNPELIYRKIDVYSFMIYFIFIVFLTIPLLIEVLYKLLIKTSIKRSFNEKRV